MALDTDGAFEFVAKRMQERLGVGVSIRRGVLGGAIIETRYKAHAELPIPDVAMLSTGQLGEALIEGCLAAKLHLCAHVQKELMGFEDRDEQRQIIDAAYRYRIACMEAQHYWERFAKSERGSAAGDYLKGEYLERKRRAEALRSGLVKAAAAGQEQLP